MDKSAKMYKLAMEKYHSGYIDEAIECCEKSISINMSNAASINLKGLLSYLKGELEVARNLWKMNIDINKDSVSKKYIESIKKDEERRNSYNSALRLINEMKINNALELLRDCEKSDFNSINVNNAIATCLIRQGKYEDAIKYIEKVKSIDKKNQLANESRKTLIEYGIIKREFPKKKVSMAVVIIAIFLSIIYIAAINKDEILEKVNGIKGAAVIQEAAKEENNTVQNNQPQNDIVQETKQEVPIEFPYNDIKQALEQKNYDNLYTLYNEWNGKAQSVNEKTIISNCEQLLANEGLEFFYSEASQSFKNGDYTKAIELYNKAYKVGKNNYRYSHIVFFMGAAYEKMEDYDSAIKYYEEYYNNYKGREYEEENLYKLCIIYSNADKGKAKIYADELSNKYPNSIYNNSVIKNIIKNN